MQRRLGKRRRYDLVPDEDNVLDPIGQARQAQSTTSSSSTLVAALPFFDDAPSFEEPSAGNNAPFGDEGAESDAVAASTSTTAAAPIFITTSVRRSERGTHGNMRNRQNAETENDMEDEGEVCDRCQKSGFDPVMDLMVLCDDCRDYGRHGRCFGTKVTDAAQILRFECAYCELKRLKKEMIVHQARAKVDALKAKDVQVAAHAQAAAIAFQTDADARTQNMQAALEAYAREQAGEPNLDVVKVIYAFDGAPPTLLFNHNVTALQRVLNKKGNAANFMNMKYHVKGAHVGREMEADKLMDMISAVFEDMGIAGSPKLPAIDVHRKISSIIDVRSAVVLLETEFPNDDYKLSTNFHYVDPVRVVLELYLSAMVQSKGCFRKFGAKDCRGGLNMGNAEDALIKKIEELYPNFDPEQEIVISIVLFSDATVVTNHKLHPFILYLEGMDYYARVANMEVSCALVALLPTIHSLMAHKVVDGTRVRVPLEEVPQASVTHGLRRLKQEATNVLVELLATGERGFVLPVNGKMMKARIVVSRFVTDMEERRDMLDVHRGYWPCYHCYSFGGSEADVAELVAKSQFVTAEALNAKRREPRSQTTDTYFRFVVEEAVKNCKTKTEKDNMTRLGGRLFGIKTPCNSPFNKGLFMSDSPANYFPPEPLHMMDGVVKRVALLLKESCSSRLFEHARRYGNETLEIPNGKYSIHIMEKGYVNVRSLLLTLRDASFVLPGSVSNGDRVGYQKLIGFLMELMWLLKDDAVLEMIDHLKIVCKDLHAGLSALVTGDVNLTPKVHELLHVPAMVERYGCAKKLFGGDLERYHAVIKNSYEFTNRHVGQSHATMLERANARRVFDSVEALSESTIDSSIRPKPIAKFRIVSAVNYVDGDVAAYVNKRVRVFCDGLRFIGLPDRLQSPFDESLLQSMSQNCQFGIKLACSIVCGVREKIIKSEESIRAFVGMPETRYFDVLSYVKAPSSGVPPSPSVPFPNVEACTLNGCMIHASALELFAPISREVQTLYGLPLFFYSVMSSAPKAVVLKLERLPLGPDSVSALALIECIANERWEIVSASRIRGVCQGYREQMSGMNVTVFPARRVVDKS